MRDKYKLILKFKDQKTMEIEAETPVNPRDMLTKELDNRWTNVLAIGDFFIKKDDILWIKVEGEELEKHIRE